MKVIPPQQEIGKLGIPQTVEARRAYRELIVTRPVWVSHSGAILYDETSASRRKMELPSLKSSWVAGIIPGIKVDTGAKTWRVIGRENNRRFGRMRDAWLNTHKWGPFCQVARGDCRGRWHSQPGLHRGQPQALARYAALCQEAGLVPVVEPEVLMDGDHTLKRAAMLRRKSANGLQSLCTQRVLLEGMILKPSMCFRIDLPPARGSERSGRRRTAVSVRLADRQQTCGRCGTRSRRTVRCLLRAVPLPFRGLRSCQAAIR